MAMFTYGGRNLAEVEAKQVVGKPRLAGYEVELTVYFSMVERNDDPRIVYVDGVVALVTRDAGERTIGETRPSIVDLPSTIGRGHPVTLVLPLSGAQVRALDLARDEHGGLPLSANLRILVDGPGGVRPHWQTVHITLTDSDWRRFLREMKFEERATFEVPVEGGRVVGNLAQAAKEFKGALDRRDARDWTHTLTQCRRALDELDHALPPSPPPRAQWDDHSPSGFKSWTLAQRIEFVRQALDLLTQPGPHPGIGEPSPKEAHYMTALTGLLLWLSATPDSYIP